MFVKINTWYLNLDQVIDVNVIEDDDNIKLIFNRTDQHANEYSIEGKKKPEEETTDNLKKLRQIDAILGYLNSKTIKEQS